ncbi:GDP-6-deoxy-D-mannose reductase [Sinobacterium norvegicum]|uniref:GDP-6-deoxy-D-mannose reductase n=1 Tax=Sinobacterium norvegicum TaxID=1641715 RepID=A0ABM9AFN5_9GAMM|nr:GDP-mannose 4,6-dehydratase [Sinobacterium norvegicum]CAH0992006.1 GDP-6-deoxy-D-mannose reductase [Sinobacterium norvegicum]
MKHVLLTGAGGFVGKVLKRYLIEAGFKVTGTTHLPPSEHETDLIQLDIRNSHDVSAAVQQCKPTHVVHLAAVTHVPTSFDDPQRTWQTNVMGTLNLLEAVKSSAPNAFVLFVSSSEVYGASFKSGDPLQENARCQPMNPYAASKLAAELLMHQFFKQGHCGAIARPFNHIGPGQSADFVTGSFAKQIANIEHNTQETTIKVGNLDAYRDFLDVRDVCHAYIALLKHCKKIEHQKVFNIASGKPVKIADVLSTLLSHSSAKITIEQDPSRLRPSDIPIAAGDCREIERVTGWKPLHTIDNTLMSLLNDWRSRR